MTVILIQFISLQSRTVFKMFLFLIFWSVVTKYVFAANILFISPIESVSHHIWNEVLVQGLLEKGHNITLIGHNDANIKSENYTVHRITGFEGIYDDIELDTYHTNSYVGLLNFWDSMTTLLVVPHLKSDALKTLLEYPRDKFDLIIFDLICGHEFYPLIEYFGNPPVIGISPFGLPPYILDAMGSHFYYYFPFYDLPYTNSMTFLQRVDNTLLYILDYILKLHHMPNIYKMAQERYGKDITPFDQIEKRIGLLLANYDPILDIAQPLSPNIIPVGGLHVRRSAKLTDDLQKILDDANDGAIFFSFGTIVQPSQLPPEKKKTLLSVFSKLNQTVLWKYASDDLKDIPKNVIVRKWYPQNDILAHKNVKLFITHSGGLSSHEVMNHGVPVLSVPFFADQKAIAGKMTTRKLGKQLHISEITENSLYETIIEVIHNPIYKENMQRISRLFRDQKETPLDRAIFWIEYALRNKDLSHLSLKARNMTWIQKENLDVYCVILLFIIVVFNLFIKIIKYVLNRLFFKKNNKLKEN